MADTVREAQLLQRDKVQHSVSTNKCQLLQIPPHDVLHLAHVSEDAYCTNCMANGRKQST